MIKKTLTMLLAGVLALAALTGCTPNEQQPAETVQPSFGIVEQVTGTDATGTDASPTDLSSPTDQDLDMMMNTGNELAVEMLLTATPVEAEYDAEANETFARVTVLNITNVTIRGGLLIDAYDGDTLVASASAVVEPEDEDEVNEDNTILAGQTVLMFASFEGKDVSKLDLHLRLDPENPMKQVP